MSKQVRAPLFDRLVDHEPGSHRESPPLRTLDREGLRESVRRELGFLLNTWAPLPSHRLEARERSVIDYGVPDFAHFSPASFEDRQRLASALRQAIEAYEPRLSQVRVEVSLGPGELPMGRVPARARSGAADHEVVRAQIRAALIFDEVAEPVSFLTLFAKELAEVEVVTMREPE